MEKIKSAMKTTFDFLAAPLEWISGVVAKYPKGALIVWLVSLALTAWKL